MRYSMRSTFIYEIYYEIYYEIRLNLEGRKVTGTPWALLTVISDTLGSTHPNLSRKLLIVVTLLIIKTLFYL